MPVVCDCFTVCKSMRFLMAVHRIGTLVGLAVGIWGKDHDVCVVTPGASGEMLLSPEIQLVYSVQLPFLKPLSLSFSYSMNWTEEHAVIVSTFFSCDGAQESLSQGFLFHLCNLWWWHQWSLSYKLKLVQNGCGLFFFTTSVSDFDPRDKFCFLFSYLIAEMRFCPILVSTVWILLRQTGFPS